MNPVVKLPVIGCSGPAWERLVAAEEARRAALTDAERALEDEFNRRLDEKIFGMIDRECDNQADSA